MTEIFDPAWGLPHGEPRAYVDHGIFGQRLKIYLATRVGSGDLYVIHGDGSIRKYDPAEQMTTEPTQLPTLDVPDNLGRALLGALAAHYGGVSEVRQLRKDYDAERARVDRLIGNLVERAKP
jgi:hypothetical protein